MLSKYNHLKNTIKINDDYIYFIESIDDSAGFYLYKNKIVFIVRQVNEKVKITDVSTDYLHLITGVSIKAVLNDPDFKEGLFNILSYGGDYSEEEVDLFVRLCKLYLDSKENMTILTFFQLIKNMFNKSKESDKTAAVGLFGELSIIYRAYKMHKLDLSKFWHTNGIYSKYDFIIGDLLLEVKTTTSSNYQFKIKHDQIFSVSNVFVSTVSVENNESGITLTKLVDMIKAIPEFYKNIKFIVNIEKALLNVVKPDYDSYIVKEVRVYNTSQLDTIKILSDGVTNVHYDYNFSNQDFISEENFFGIIKKG